MFEEVMMKERDMIPGLVRPYMEILPCRTLPRFGHHWGLPAHFAPSHPCQEGGEVDAGHRDEIVSSDREISGQACAAVEQKEV